MPIFFLCALLFFSARVPAQSEERNPGQTACLPPYRSFALAPIDKKTADDLASSLQSFDKVLFHWDEEHAAARVVLQKETLENPDNRAELDELWTRLAEKGVAVHLDEAEKEVCPWPLKIDSSDSLIRPMDDAGEKRSLSENPLDIPWDGAPDSKAKLLTVSGPFPTPVPEVVAEINTSPSPEQESDDLKPQPKSCRGFVDCFEREFAQPLNQSGETIALDKKANPTFKGMFGRALLTASEWINDKVLAPLTDVYESIVPKFVRHRISDFFNNLRSLYRAFNNMLQGNIKGIGTELGRFAVNSTVGVAGFYDFAENHLHWHNTRANMNQTFGTWGIKESHTRKLTAYITDLILGPLTNPLMIAMPGIATLAVVSVGSSTIGTFQSRSCGREQQSATPGGDTPCSVGVIHDSEPPVASF